MKNIFSKQIFRINPLLSLFAVLLFIDHSHAQNAIGSQTKNLQPETSNQLRGAGPTTSFLPAGTALRANGMSFTPNKGQFVDANGKPCPDVLYKGSGNGADIYLRKTGISYVQSNMGEVLHEVDKQVEELISTQPENTPDIDRQHLKDELLRKMNIKIHRVDMDFVGCNNISNTVNKNASVAKAIEAEEVDGYQNFYYAHLPAVTEAARRQAGCPQGITNVHQYNKITYKNIYDGIDITYYGNKQNGVKYDLIVQPHADPGQIKLQWKGADELKIRDGKLIIKTSLNEFTESLPKVYQVINGEIIDVKTKYVITPLMKGEAIINFSFSIYNSSFPLVVDPWATYYGGNLNEQAAGIATDNAGNVIITGYTGGGTFPITPGAHQILYGGGFNDVYVVKLDPTGNLLWATYYGGNKNDDSNGITTDNLGNVIITGSTYLGSFPTTPGAQQTVSGGFWDAFVVKFDPAGNRLWATFYGGNMDDAGYSISTDNVDNVIITGMTQGGSFSIGATAGNVVQQAVHGGGGSDAFIVKLDPGGNRLWATFYGGDQSDSGLGIATDNAGNVSITGITAGGTFPITPGAQQTGFAGGLDAFVVKFDPAGNRLWATYYGGAQNDRNTQIATDNAGNLIITGYTTGGTFPIGFAPGNVVQQPVFGGNYDAFVVKFDPAGNRQWATYYGSNQYEWGFSVVADANNNIYLLMEAEDEDSPTLIDACSYQPVFNGGYNDGPGGVTEEDQTIVKFKPTGEKLCATYLGGTREDDLERPGNFIALFGNTLFITGSTLGGYPVTQGGAQTIHGGLWDAFVASICTNICEGKTSLGLSFTAATSVCANAPVTFTPTITNSCDTTGYKFHWTFTGGNPATSDSVNPAVSFSGIGSHDVKLVVTTLCKKDSITQVNYITTTQCVVCNLVGQFTKGTSGCSGCGCKQWILVNASGGTSPYSYSWPDGYDKRYKNRLCPGAYTIKIVDKNGCSTNINLTAP